MKPKENTISKINSLFEKVYAAESFKKLDDDSKGVLKELKSHVNTMNLHRAKVVYFSSVKSSLNRVLELLDSDAVEELPDLIREMKGFLHAGG